MAEWIISGNPKKYDVIGAFHALKKIDWVQSANIVAGDIVYLYVSGDIKQLQFKCRANKVELSEPDIDDRIFDVSGEFDGKAGRYMELEMLEEFSGKAYSRGELMKYGFQSPMGPVHLPQTVKVYLESIVGNVHSNGQFDSWIIVDESTAIKKTDKVFFEYKKSDIPADIRWFFDAEKLVNAEKISVEMIYRGVSYDAYISKEQKELGKIRINWSSNLASIFSALKPDDEEEYPTLTFKKLASAKYKVFFNKERTEKRYSVNQAIWIATALMSAEVYSKDSAATVEDYYFKQSSIVKRAQLMADKKVDAARCSWWCCADQENRSNNYLRGDWQRDSTARRLTRFDEFPEKTHPEDLDMDDILVMNGNEMSMEELFYFVENQYPTVFGVNTDIEKGENETPDPEYWPSLSEYDPGITREMWLELLNDKEITFESNLKMFKMILELGGEATFDHLAEVYGGVANSYNIWGNSFGMRVHNRTGCPLVADEESERYYIIPFVCKRLDENRINRYSWKFRDELKEALEEMDLSRIDITGTNIVSAEFDNNMILYGPPGTGKTYNSAIYAVAICTGRTLEDVASEPYSHIMECFDILKKEGRVAFTTFHQSYGYEEFIEGIKPVVNKEDASGISYTIEDGVFKAFCRRAGETTVEKDSTALIGEKPRIWGMILGGTGMNDIKRKCFDNDEIRLSWREVKDDDIDGEYFADEKVSWNGKHMVADFKNEMSVGDIVVIEKSLKSIDAIGVITGEYEYENTEEHYPRRRKVQWLVRDVDIDVVPYLPSNRKQLSRFSLFAFDYIGMEAISDILSKVQINPTMKVSKESRPYVFIIDEINRGNISKIFGELITLIERTKREGMEEQASAILPYSGDIFSVPKNIYILGTMNTADRSIALMDTALRRRFQFVEMMPDPNVLRKIGADKVDDLDVAAMLEKINERITFLFDREHTIGHAFFTNLAKNPSVGELHTIFEKSVIPLLQEYFYEDYQKIQLVLGDNGKSDPSTKFILDEEVKLASIFKGNAEDIVDLPEKRFSINKEAFSNLESYKQIM